jgi:hypothetical protein
MRKVLLLALVAACLTAVGCSKSEETAPAPEATASAPMESNPAPEASPSAAPEASPAASPAAAP